MRFGGRLAAAIEVLDDIETRHRPIAGSLKDWGVSHRFAGSGDRAAIGNLVYDALRWRLSIGWIMGEATPRALVLGTVARHWGFGRDALAREIEGDPHAPSPLSEAETDRIANAKLDEAPDYIRADVPEWLAPKFVTTFGPDWIGEGEALALRPPLDMRVNRLKADRAKVAKALSRFGARDAAYSPMGLRIAPTSDFGRHPNVQVEPAFRKGWFEIQDEGSQIAAMMVGADAGEQVLDLCAGAGGKTLALSAAMANKGQVLATDGDRTRLAPIFERLKRAGTRNAQVREAGASLDDLEGRMDAVLVDAPCTGSGVWRRRPDAKWWLSERALSDRLGEQAELLVSAAHYVKPGGRLVYVTCSLLAEENDDQVAKFSSAHPEFTPSSGEDILAGSGLPEDSRKRLAEASLATKTGLILTPRRTGTDGFFIAVLRRN
jgi:16S rRNA (cytosine967-C5)-methyltransferase